MWPREQHRKADWILFPVFSDNALPLGAWDSPQPLGLTGATYLFSPLGSEHHADKCLLGQRSVFFCPEKKIKITQACR
jgi:hypothetical protein